MRTRFAILTLLFAASLAAQPLTVGTQIVDAGGTATITTGGPVTYVNLSAGATAAGTVNKATVAWSASCSNAFKIVFLRNNFGTLSAFTVVATRGPFNAVSGRNVVTLSPPVTVSQGDLIGVVQLQSLAACGSVRTQSFASTNTGYNLVTLGDMSVSGGTVGSSSVYSSGLGIGAIAFSSDPLLVRILPAAGALQGSNAFFRTALQMMNPTSNTITGNLVFHKQLQSAGPSDPSLAFTLLPGQSISYPDVITSMGTSGLGSLDIVTTGGNAPIATARVFSDGGANGTSGFSEEALSPNDALDFFSRGILLIPADLTNFRMNIGVRTLDTGAVLDIATVDSAGVPRATRTVTYGANIFDQVPVATFTGASTVPPGGAIIITFNTFGGRAFVYSSVIDNRPTVDSTYRLADIK
ncbi:MAG TPA: hypothetical protein VGQ46_16350 [Thermoanaerobaculia bacterium]|jgi:hypothetical protein|nr:hypothetical protein [Thermoanaerobaculia bacterium]